MTDLHSINRAKHKFPGVKPIFTVSKTGLFLNINSNEVNAREFSSNKCIFFINKYPKGVKVIRGDTVISGLTAK